MDSYKNVGFKEIQGSDVSYAMHLPYVNQVLNSWSVCNEHIPKDRRDLVKALLEHGLQLQMKDLIQKRG